MTVPPSTNKTLIIAGPTACGKTSLALKIAQSIPATLISADSRQVYQNLDYIPGKDIPPDFNRQQAPITFQNHSLPYYTNSHTHIFGYDVVKPTQDWSVALFNRLCRKLVPHIHKHNRLPIIVGGTGLYIKSLTQSIETLHIPPNLKLRRKLNQLTTPQLQQKLDQINPTHFSQLNRSDKHNPRRLIRAIEVSNYKNNQSQSQPKQFLLNPKTTLKILLTAPQTLINKRIKKRVRKRFKQNWQPELKLLQSIDPRLTSPCATSLGYTQLNKYQTGQLSKKQALQAWAQREQKYSKDQISWFNNQPNYKKTPINTNHYPKKVVRYVSRWYSNP